MAQVVLDQILELAQQQGAEAEVFYLEQDETPIQFEANRLKSLQTKAQRGIALRVIHEGRLGFASSTDLARPELLVAAALQTASIGDPADLTFAHQPPQLSSEPPAPTLPTTGDLVAKGKELISRLREFNPDLLIEAEFDIRRNLKIIATTGGIHVAQQSQGLGASLGANWVRGEDMLNVYSYRVARDEPLDYESLIHEVQSKLAQATATAHVTSGTMPVIFTPRAVTMILGGLVRSIFAGQAVVQKSSPVADKVGELLFDSRLNIYEDPMVGPAHTQVDDEGTPTQKKYFIQGGRVQGFYWDRTWAKRGGVVPTGNGFRGGLSRPTARPVNLCMDPGEVSLAEMIASLKEGVIVDQVLGAGQSNQLAGEFSVNLDLGYKVEKGEVVGRLKNTMVAGNFFTAGQAIEAIGSQAEWVFGSAKMPALLFKSLGVASRA